MRTFHLGLLTLIFTVSIARSTEVREAPELAAAFTKEGAIGTFVLFDVERDTMWVHDRKRAEERFVPASTFKIVNTLIGLHTAAVKDVDEVLPYGGKPQPIPAWERDMSLRQAMPISNVPIYQELARRIGRERMIETLAPLRYGNGEVGSVVDRFWLDGPLKISALEQAEFLGRLAARKLPFRAEHIAALEEITRFADRDGERIFAKTGWQPPVGWWAGWIRRGQNVYAFALNMEMREMKDAPKRIAIGEACLRLLEGHRR